jgi:hypothetical protein
MEYPGLDVHKPYTLHVRGHGGVHGPAGGD